ncbi:transmembrane amino acid transporter protein-domain-containing protein [Staphylotrichum tortipilum]|uniref:Transmembrane amino acid transporter protein-domain-containing protein n=1 Tax=Staphylotrichum tortipilum TaxID=2831512 RepID=A0AAN6MDP0_9PEZI|nr:transmembrane amino acid transporter protein-domain-containing protein [Staphylotrichum longicolle]
MSDTRATSRDRGDTGAAAQVVAEHLPSGYTAEFHHTGGNTTPGDTDGNGPASLASGSATPAVVASEESSLKLQGGDMHRDLFKLDAAAKGRMHRRAATFHSPRELQQDEAGPSMTVGDQLAPGGFRRAFLHHRHGDDFLAARMPITRNFVEFLDLYGSFAGEDLVDTDEEAIAEEEEEEERAQAAGERRPLLWQRVSAPPRPPRSAEAGTVKTFFTLIKAFVGTGIMFLPKAFSNGGILFSTIAMLSLSAITMVAFHLLLQCKLHYGGGYGEIGNAIAGPRMRGLILFSIALSQLGFVCTGIVFVAENLLTFFNAVSNNTSPFTTPGLIALQLFILVPLAWIRNIAKLGPAALLADVCILVGVSYIYWATTTSIAAHGVAESVVLFNPHSYALTIGTAIFTYEGIGLILPIQSSMREPHRFEPLLAAVMVIITLLFTSVGALCYATFGARTQIEIINNFPRGSGVVNTVQLLYAIAVLVGTPVQLFPALRILEGRVLGHMRSGKGSLRTKWVKNAFRFGVVAVCGLVSVAGTGNLDRFVALIGSAACVPLVYVYPAYLHWKGVATSRWAKWGDVVMMVGGMGGMVFTTAVTIAHSFM